MSSSPRIRLRQPGDNDWPAILAAAVAALPWAHEANLQWLQNRQRFDESRGVRRHYVAEDASSQKVIGYGAIESDAEPGSFRVFIVTAPELLATTGEQLYDRLLMDLQEVGATKIWAREEARDTSLLDFFRARGLAEAERFTSKDGLEIVRVERAAHGGDRTLCGGTRCSNY